MQFEQLGVPRVQRRARGAVRRPQRRPARLQEPRRPPHAAGAGAQVRALLLAPGQRDQPLRPLRALRQARRDPGRRRLAHDHQRRAGHDRDRRRRARRRRRHGRLPVRDRLPEGRRGPARGRRWRGRGCRRRTSSSSCCAGVARSGGKNKVFEFTGPGTADLLDPRARDDRQHDRRARRDLRGLPDPTTRRATGWRIQQREDDFAELGARRRREYDERVEIDLDAARARWSPSRHNPDNVVPVEEVAGTELAQVCIGSSVNSGYDDLALPARSSPTRAADRAPRASPRPPRRARVRSSAAIAESGVYRQLVEGGVRMLEPVCGPCVGMGQAPPSGRQLAAHLQPQLPRAARGHREDSRLPLLAGGRGGVAADGEDRRPARVRRAARDARPARACALRRRRPHLRAGRRGRGGAHRDPARPEHQARRPSTCRWRSR